MSDFILSKWLTSTYLRTLLLDPVKHQSTCVQIARFVAAYYLDYVLFLRTDEDHLPSLYIWGNMKEEDLRPTDVLLDRVKVSAMLPVEFSPALPALLLVKCDCVIEAISYVDHFDDRRTSMILRLLADSIHQKELIIDYIQSMITDNISAQLEECFKNNSMTKFSQNFTESVLQLDVAMQNDLVIFLEQHLISTAEFIYSELSLESEESLPNPVYEMPHKLDTEEAKSFAQIYGYIQILMDSIARSNRIVDQLNYTVKIMSNEQSSIRISQNYTLHRVLLLMLRITYRHLFSVAVRENDKNAARLAERYKQLLGDENGEHLLLQKWFSTAEEEEMERVQSFIDLVQNNYHQSSSLPPLNAKTREMWLRRIVLNSTTNHRDIRQERTIDWFRSVCNPKHRVCDVVMSQMLFINSQWTSPGFSFIQPGCLALRLSIHPHDLCLGTTAAAVNYSASARDILYSPQMELSKFVEVDGKLFTPRDQQPASPDLISKYAKKFREQESLAAQTARVFNPFEEKMRVFSRQQDLLEIELAKEREFLNSAGNLLHPEPYEEFPDPPKHIADETLAKTLNMLNEKIDAVVKELAERNNRSMYIREEDEESEMADLPLHYDDAPVSQDTPSIEKLDFGLLSSRTPAPSGSQLSDIRAPIHNLPHSIPPSNLGSLSTAKSFTNPLFTDVSLKSGAMVNNIPVEWMKLLPLEPGSDRFADNLLIYNHNSETTPRAQLPISARKVVSDRGIQTRHPNGTTSSITKKIGETQTDSGFLDGHNNTASASVAVAAKSKKVVDVKSMRNMSEEDIRMVLDRVAI